MGLDCGVFHGKTGPAYLLPVNKHDDYNCWYVLEIIWLCHWSFTFRYDHSFKLMGKYALKNATIIFFAINTMTLWLRYFKYLSTYLAEPVCFCFANGSSSGCFKHGAEADAPPKTLLYPKVWNGRCFWHTDMYLPLLLWTTKWTLHHNLYVLKLFSVNLPIQWKSFHKNLGTH